MHLLLRRSQRDDGLLWSSITFLLDARLELSAEEQELVEKYNLLPFTVYDSDARTEYADKAYQHFDDAAKVPLFSDDVATALQNSLSSLWSSICGAANAVMTAFSLRITYADLVAGCHVECEDLAAIVTAEQAIAEATELLAHYLKTAVTFDGREELHEY